MLTTPEVLPHPALLTAPVCCLCGSHLRTVLNLGRTPLASGTLAFGEKARLHRLHIHVCDACLLVQVQGPLVPPARPGTSVNAHAHAPQDHAPRFTAALQQRLALGPASLVVEIGDGLPGLRAQFDQAGIPVLSDGAQLTAASAMEIA